MDCNVSDKLILTNTVGWMTAIVYTAFVNSHMFLARVMTVSAAVFLVFFYLIKKGDKR